MLSRNLEESLHRAIALASERRHEYATLEHLLFALTEDRDAVAVLRACGVDNEKLQKELSEYLDGELEMLVASLEEDPKPTASACPSTRSNTCPIVWPGGSDWRKRIGCHVLRTGEPRCLLPAVTGHDPL